jgi:LmbE family N-acetylglucosaminyl deacetylase
MAEPETVLAVFAHPDDETYGPGATLARLGAEGAAVRLITMTRGESATMGDSPLYSPEFLAATRVKELQCACRALGISRHETLDFPDKGLAAVPEEDLAAPVLAALLESRPRLVITFHPEGISGHEDHKTVTRIVRGALSRLAEEGRWGPGEGGARGEGTKLAYYVLPESVASKIEYRRLYSVPDAQVTHAVESGPYIRAKLGAAECHKTQRYMLERLFEYHGGIEAVWRYEYFVVEGESPGERPKAALLEAK